MSVNILIPPFLKHLTDNARAVSVTGNTVSECLNDFVEQYPGIEEHLFDKDGGLRGYIEVFINSNSTYPEELTMQVNSGDELSILFLVAGG